MNSKRPWTLTVAMLLIWWSHPNAQGRLDGTPVEVRGGTVTFHVDTNVSALSVHGRSSELDARVRLRQGVEGTTLEQIQAVVPVKSLATGMGLRDEHMRKYIFTTTDGQRPDVKFASEGATCSRSGSGPTSICEVAGELTIRGASRPFAIALKVIDEGRTFKVVGDAVVKLSTYGIERPSQLGVRTEDEVKLHMEFRGRSAAPELTANLVGVQ